MAANDRIGPDRRIGARSPTLARGASWAGLSALLFAAAIGAAAELGFSRSVTPGLVAHYVGLFGPGARGRLEGWKAFVRDTAGRAAPARHNPGEAELLGRVNRFFNGVPSATDLALWGVADYWATPSETLSIDGADCEDYAIAKYFTLKELGIPVARLRLVYAKTWWSQNAHMVLAYYGEPGADPLILDNLAGSIQRASERPDLIPVYTFNDDDLLFHQKDAGVLRVSPSSARQWRELLEKLARELTY